MVAPSSAVTAGIQGLLVGVLALAFGYLVVSALSTVSRIRLDPLTRWSLSVFGLALVTGLLMVAHIASRGAVYSNSDVVRASVVIIVVACIVVRAKVRRPQAEDARGPRGSTWLVALIVTTAAIAIWALPIFRLLPLHFGGDTMQHLMRASELRAGNSTPATPLAAAVPNDYPYLFHAMLAFLSHFTPGGRASHAYAPMMVILAGGGALTLFGLGKELTEKIAGGFFLVLFGTLSGGIGFLVSRGPAAVSGPRNAEALSHYLGDFVWNRSYNFAFHNLAPPYPRDLSFALLGAFLLLLVIGVRRRSLPNLFAAGTATGLLGLTGGEAFFVALGISCVAALWVVVHRPVLSGLVLLLPALILYALWAVPMLVNYLKFGGFANLSLSTVSVPALSILGAWGVITPFALIGASIVILHLRKDPISRLVAIAVAIPVAFVLLTSIGAEWLPPGLSTLGRPHRYWPLISLGVALLACVGATWVVTRYRRSGRLVPAIVILVAATLALASPVLGSIGYIQETSPDPILQAALTGDPKSVLTLLSPRPEGNCTVSVPESLSRLVPAFSGYRVMYYPGRGRPQARIRWPDIAVRSRANRSFDQQSLQSESLTPSAFEKITGFYGLDAIVLPSARPIPPLLRGLESETAATGETIVWINEECHSQRFVVPPKVAEPSKGA